MIVGASTDVLGDQSKFVEKESLNFALVADPKKELATACGVLRPNGFADRVTFIVNKDGKIAKIYEKVDPTKHPKEVYDYVKEHLSGESKATK